MRNLAGSEDKTHATDYCRDELTRCGIEVVEIEGDPKGEVQSRVVGRLGQFKFDRAWYYWCVSGPVPLHIAEELYENIVGRRDIRVAGHCGCPPPIEWVKSINLESGRQIVSLAERDKMLAMSSLVNGKTEEEFLRDTCDMMNWEFGDEQDGKPCVMSYHIDSELGLYIFAETIKRHGLV